MASMLSSERLVLLLMDWLLIDAPTPTLEWQIVRERVVADRAALLAELSALVTAYVAQAPQLATVVSDLRSGAAPTFYHDGRHYVMQLKDTKHIVGTDNEGVLLALVHATHIDTCIRQWYAEDGTGSTIEQRRAIAEQLAATLRASLAHLGTADEHVAHLT